MQVWQILTELVFPPPFFSLLDALHLIAEQYVILHEVRMSDSSARKHGRSGDSNGKNTGRFPDERTFRWTWPRENSILSPQARLGSIVI